MDALANTDVEVYSSEPCDEYYINTETFFTIIILWSQPQEEYTAYSYWKFWLDVELAGLWHIQLTSDQ
jgi:hypothetical protein